MREMTLPAFERSRAWYTLNWNVQAHFGQHLTWRGSCGPNRPLLTKLDLFLRSRPITIRATAIPSSHSGRRIIRAATVPFVSARSTFTIHLANALVSVLACLEVSVCAPCGHLSGGSTSQASLLLNYFCPDGPYPTLTLRRSQIPWSVNLTPSWKETLCRLAVVRAAFWSVVQTPKSTQYCSSLRTMTVLTITAQITLAI